MKEEVRVEGEDSQKLLTKAQMYQQRYQEIVAQKETLNVQLMEVKSALEEIEKGTDAEIYKVTGPILIKTNKDDVKKDLTEKSEIIELRLRSLKKEEAAIKDGLEKIKDKLTG